MILASDVENKSEHENKRHLAKSTVLVGSMTILSRILGFMRDMVCAIVFGAAGSYDAFIVAFKIPNFLRRLFAEGAFAQAFVPILSDYRATRSKEAAHKLLNNVFGVLGLVLLVVSVVGMLAAPIIIKIFAPGFINNGARLYLAIDLLRITFPYIFFISLTVFLGSILNSFDRFSMPALTPVLLNIAMIASALLFAGYFAEPVTALAWGVFFGGVLQLLFLIFCLWRINLLPRPKLSGDEAGVRRILKNMLPAIFGVSVAQINLLLDTVFASFLPKGSISWLYYSDRLMEFPLGVFGVALATVVLPQLSRQHARNAKQDFEHTLDWSLQLIMLIGLPASLGLIFLAEPLIITLFNYGKFTVIDVYKSSASLQAYAGGLLAFVSTKILASAHYARKDIKTPVKIATLCMIVNIILNVILMQFFYHVGLALAMAITGFLNAGLLLAILIKKDIYTPTQAWKLFLIKVLIANLAWVLLLKIFITIFIPGLDLWFKWGFINRVIILSGFILAVILVYTAVLRFLGFDFKKQLILD